MSHTAQAACMSDSVAQGLPASVDSRSLAKARQAFQELEEWLLSEETRKLPMHEVEQEQERRGREIQRLLLEAHVTGRGYGDVGPAIEGASISEPGVVVCHSRRRLDGIHPRTIFGPISVNRLGYCHEGQVSIHPLDEQLQLPARSFS